MEGGRPCGARGGASSDEATSQGAPKAVSSHHEQGRGREGLSPGASGGRTALLAPCVWTQATRFVAMRHSGPGDVTQPPRSLSELVALHPSDAAFGLSSTTQA